MHATNPICMYIYIGVIYEEAKQIYFYHPVLHVH